MGLNQLKITRAVMKPILGLALSAGLVLSAGGPAWTQEAFQSVTDLAVPVEVALKAKAENKRVLVVFDIDDTILTVQQDLGSEAWQAKRLEAIRAMPAETHAAQYELFFTEQAMWSQVSSMEPTQDNTAALIAQLQASGIDVFALTARDPKVRGQTERELARAKMDFSGAPECIKPLCVKRGRLTDTEIRAAAKKAGVALPAAPYKPVTVSDGIMMLEGQDKGIMLQLLTASLGQKYDLILMIDDSPRNVENVARAAKVMTTPVLVYRYEGVWDKGEALHADPARLKAADALSDAVRATLCVGVVSQMCGHSYSFPAAPVDEKPLP